MNLTVFEHDRPFVIEALRRGEVDYLENVSEAAEANLFRHLIDRQVLERLAKSYPSPREKEEVPVWFYLASQISLRLHGVPGFNTAKEKGKARPRRLSRTQRTRSCRRRL